jgi:hypothetical protein
MPYRKKRVSKTCGVCNAEFQGKSNQKYCSPACARHRQKEQLADLAEYRSRCPKCGHVLTPKSGRRRKHPTSGPEARPIRQDTKAVTTPAAPSPNENPVGANKPENRPLAPESSFTSPSAELGVGASGPVCGPAAAGG